MGKLLLLAVLLLGNHVNTFCLASTAFPVLEFIAESDRQFNELNSPEAGEQTFKSRVQSIANLLEQEQEDISSLKKANRFFQSLVAHNPCSTQQKLRKLWQSPTLTPQSLHRPQSLSKPLGPHTLVGRHLYRNNDAVFPV